MKSYISRKSKTKSIVLHFPFIPVQFRRSSKPSSQSFLPSHNKLGGIHTLPSQENISEEQIAPTLENQKNEDPKNNSNILLPIFQK